MRSSDSVEDTVMTCWGCGLGIGDVIVDVSATIGECSVVDETPEIVKMNFLKN